MGWEDRQVHRYAPRAHQCRVSARMECRLAPARERQQGQHAQGRRIFPGPLLLCSCLALQIWDLKTYKLKTDLPGHTDEVYCVDFVADKIVSGGRDRTVKMYVFPSGSLTEGLMSYSTDGRIKNGCRGTSPWYSATLVDRSRPRRLSVRAVVCDAVSVRPQSSDPVGCLSPDLSGCLHACHCSMLRLRAYTRWNRHDKSGLMTDSFIITACFSRSSWLQPWGRSVVSSRGMPLFFTSTTQFYPGARMVCPFL